MPCRNRNSTVRSLVDQCNVARRSSGFIWRPVVQPPSVGGFLLSSNNVPGFVCCFQLKSGTTTVVDMRASARQKLSALLQNPLVAVVQASSVLHCINEYVFSITTVSDGVVPFFVEESWCSSTRYTMMWANRCNAYPWCCLVLIAGPQQVDGDCHAIAQPTRFPYYHRGYIYHGSLIYHTIYNTMETPPSAPVKWCLYHSKWGAWWVWQLHKIKPTSSASKVQQYS